MHARCGFYRCDDGTVAAIRSAQQLLAIWPVQRSLAMIGTADNADVVLMFKQRRQ